VNVSILRRRLEQALELLMILLMAALAVVVVLGVSFRKAGMALVWYDEIASVMLAWLTYYGAAFAALKRAHIGFPKLVQSLDAKHQLVITVLREGIVLGFFAVPAWAGWEVLRVLEGLTLTSLPSVPASITQSVIPISAVLFIVAELLSFAELWPRLRSAAAERRS
jgi:TRAP-type C4-dicarboxylate transport system permease small subunit